MAENRKLGRTADHRVAMLKNMATSLIWHGQIETTEAKAKEVKSEDGSETQSQENQEVSTPTQTVKISSVTVETNGVNYGMPETLEPFNYMKWLYSLYGMEYKE